MKEVALITLHGMGAFKQGYEEDLQEKLAKRMGNAWHKVSFQVVDYYSLTHNNQEQLWKKIKSEPNNDIDWHGLRQWFLYSFSDAASLEHSAHRDINLYLDTQYAIRDCLMTALNELGNDPTKPVVIVAQSLGCQVISNYLWDAGHDKYFFSLEKNPSFNSYTENEKAFLKLHSLRNLVTTGCNIPLFNGGFSQRKCFDASHLHEFKWDNYYDADDVLGWPLRQLDDSYHIVHDHAINAGKLLTSWNPASHGGYWSDNDVIKPLANSLIQLL